MMSISECHISPPAGSGTVSFPGAGVRHARRAHGAVALQYALRRAQVGIQLVTGQKGDVYDQKMVISMGISMGFRWI